MKENSLFQITISSSSSSSWKRNSADARASLSFTIKHYDFSIMTLITMLSGAEMAWMSTNESECEGKNQKRIFISKKKNSSSTRRRSWRNFTRLPWMQPMLKLELFKNLIGIIFQRCFKFPSDRLGSCLVRFSPPETHFLLVLPWSLLRRSYSFGWSYVRRAWDGKDGNRSEIGSEK